MEIFPNLAFIRPWWLLLAPLGLLVAYALTSRLSDSWTRVCDAHLLDEMMVNVQKTKSATAWMLIAGGWMLAVAALAGPAWDKHKTELYKSADATVIVFDLSRSMNSTDLTPSRLERARYKAIEAVENLQGQSVGLVAFAGDAFDVTPISDDIRTVTHLLQSLQTDIVPAQGSNASLGLNRAGELLKRSGFESGNVILLTDGVDADAFDAAQKLLTDGYRLSVVGVGTTIGAPVRLHSGDYLKDSAGEFVVALLDRDRLSELASVGGGKLTLISSESEDLNISSLLSSQSVRSDIDSDQVSTTKWKDQGAWLLLPLIAIFAFVFRKGWLLGFSLMIFALPSNESWALEWSDLWQRSDQRAAAAITAKDYNDPSLALHSDWNAIARYRENDFERAAEEFEKLPGSTARYNQGNALAKSGDLPGAIEQYEAALRIDSEFDDAKFNLELIRQMLDEQSESEQNQSQGEESQDARSGKSQDEELRQMPQGSDSDEHLGEQQRSESAQRPGQQSQGASEMTDDEKVDDAQASADENINLQALVDEENLQVIEQLLRQVNDDPGGLLRRKFYYDAQSRGRTPAVDEPW